MSRFVSAGTNEEPPERDDEWLKAQKELDENRMRKEEASRAQDGKSLYEVLQANKASKQEAFEESIRLKNQFRSLDDDEVDFLDSVLESTRAKEAAVRKETSEQLDLFRRQQDEAEKAARAEGDEEETLQDEELWHTGGRKRKKGKDKENIKGVKLRRVSSAATGKTLDESTKLPASPLPQSGSNMLRTSSTPSLPTPATALNTQSQRDLVPVSKPSSLPGLGLGAYSSDDD